jgi:hypothetical protein
VRRLAGSVRAILVGLITARGHDVQLPPNRCPRRRLRGDRRHELRMSRLMNDIFVTVFIVAAATLLQIWSGAGNAAPGGAAARRRTVYSAAATKWGFYALIGLWILVLARRGSAGVVGRRAGGGGGGVGAVSFLVVMLGLLALALVITWQRPTG